jgi:gamma-glutamyl hercynylcysteine S-oxide synthase
MATIAPRDPIAPPLTLPHRPEEVLVALDAVRERTLALVAHLDDATLTAVLSPIMSPLVWDLAHIAAYEDLWLAHRHGGLPLLRPHLAETYDAFETPRAVRGEVELLSPELTRAYLAEVRERTAEALLARGVGEGDGTICEMVLRHELQHTETMRQTMALAHLLPPGEPPLQAMEGEDRWIDLPAGPFEMGAAKDGFAYDNERPRHTVEVPAFQIARLPVRNGDWARARGEHNDAPPDAPVCHVSWHEAHEFAASQGARLPTEAEWEKAASSGALASVGHVWEWTSSPFEGYPGFAPHPYREYSEVFFGGDYRVLRGGSWATHPRVATLTFRNWDLPVRNQIFAGVRLARDAC